jgi:signal transduction histidine kinase
MDSSVLGPPISPPPDIISCPERLEALRRTALMDSPAEEAFDRLTRLAARLLGTPVALCTLFDAERHFFKSGWGLPEPHATNRHRPLELSFCQIAAIQRGPLVIADASQDARVKDHPGVREFKIASYLGIPLLTSEGHALGTFCVFDQKARVWSEEDLQAAKDLAAVVMTEIEMRTLAQEAQRRTAEAQAAQAHAEALAARNAQLYREAQEGSRLRERLVSVVSHDLKTPLQTVVLAARQLERLAGRAGAPELEPVRKGTARIGAAATRMTALVNEMLDVVRMQTGQALDLTLAPTNLAALARHVADELGQTTLTHAIEVSEPEGELRAECDVFRIERVLSNLISNAVKYSPAEDRVLVRLREEQGPQGRWALLEVEDHGLGIPAEDLPHIFSWFQRGRNVRERIDGTGIGLASAKYVVERHGGTLTVSSQEGVGSTFTVRLPLVPV